MSAHAHAVKHHFGERGGAGDPRDVDHQFSVGAEALDVFAGVTGPVFEVVEKAGGIEARALPVVDPGEQPSLLNGSGGGSRRIFAQSPVRA